MTMFLSRRLDVFMKRTVLCPLTTGAPRARSALAARRRYAGLLWAVAAAMVLVAPDRGGLALGASDSHTDPTVPDAAAPVAQEPEEEEMFEGRLRWFLEHRKGPDGHIPRNARSKAFRQVEENLRNGLLGLSLDLTPGSVWAPLGPAPLVSGTAAWSGRVTSIAMHPVSPNTIFVGAAQGGVWKSTDAGATWTPLTDKEVSLAIGALAIDPSNPGTIYAGTGESNSSCDSYFGAGILKSTDGGTSWSLIGATPFDNTSFSRIIVHPTDPATLWAANTTGVGGFAADVCYGAPGSGTFGVWKSTNAGASWTRVLGSSQTGNSTLTHGLVIDPTNPSILYAGVDGSGVWKTVNGGTSWSLLAGGLPTSSVGQIVLAVNPNAPSNLYASVHNSSAGGLLGVFKTIDSGSTWTVLPSAPSGLCSNFCWYCMIVDVAPDGGVWLGGVSLYRSGDGGASWTNVTVSPLHVDQHALLFSGGTVWSGNDGGVFTTVNNGGSWTSKNVGIAMTQFYPGASLHPTGTTLALAGAQDNGTSKYTGTSTWTHVNGGDGSFTAIDFTNPANVWYVSSQSLVIRKTTNGSSFASATSGLSDAGMGSAAFIAPYVMCPNNASLLIAGSDNVWRTTNAAGSWSSNSPDPLTGSSISALAFAPSDTACNTYFAGTIGGSLSRTTVGGGAAGWTTISAGLPSRAVSDIAVHPANANIVYATLSGFGGPHVYKTLNALAPSPTWTATDAGIPDAPALAVLLDPLDPAVVYLGTDVGLFRSTDSGATWQVYMNGHPNVAVYDLVANAGSPPSIVSFTHGRGAFRLAAYHASELTTTYTDVCPSGGPGSGDGIVDPGETVTMPVTIVNDGPASLTGISGLLSTTGPAVSIIDDFTTWPDLAPAASSPSNPDHFTFDLADSVACGQNLDFNLALTYDQGANASPFSFLVGEPSGPPVTLLSAPFTAGTPPGWVITNGGALGGIAGTWTTVNPGGRTIGAPFASPWEIVDSQKAGDVSGGAATQNETLTSPSFDASPCAAVRLEFSNQFHWFDGSLDEIADVDVSTNGGGAWTNVLRMQGAHDGYPTPNTKTIDLSALASGQPNVKLRFHYYNGQNERWWAIDNVSVTCPVLSCHVCPGSPPGEAGVSPPLTLSLTGATLALSWGGVSAGCSGADYAIYRGTLGSLHTGVYDHASVVCSTAGATAHAMPVPAGPALYFLVTALSPTEEGSYGRSSSGAERPRAASPCKPAGNTTTCP